MKKEVVHRGSVVEAWIFRKDGKFLIENERGAKTLFEMRHYKKLVEQQEKQGKAQM